MNPYQKNSKIYDLFEQIQKNDRLNKIIKSHGKPTHLHKCIRESVNYAFLTNYAEEYVKLN